MKKRSKGKKGVFNFGGGGGGETPERCPAKVGEKKGRGAPIAAKQCRKQRSVFFNKEGHTKLEEKKMKR